MRGKIEDERVRFGAKRPGQRDPADEAPTGQKRAFADRGREPLRQVLDDGKDPGAFGGLRVTTIGNARQISPAMIPSGVYRRSKAPSGPRRENSA